MKDLRLLTVAAAAGRTGLPRKTIRRLCHTGELQFVKRDGGQSTRIYVREVSLEAWIEQQPVAPVVVFERDADTSLPPVEEPAFS